MDLAQQLHANVLSLLARTCNWEALPDAVLSAVPSTSAAPPAPAPAVATAPDSAQDGPSQQQQQPPHQHLLQHLVNRIPLDWTYEEYQLPTQHTKAAALPSQQQQQGPKRKQQRQSDQDPETAQMHTPPVHATAVGTPWGLFLLGGQQAGKLQQVHMKDDTPGFRDSIPGVFEVDCSQVYACIPSAYSRQLLQLHQPQAGGGWQVNAGLPPLCPGLIGHSAVLFRTRVYVFGGQALLDAKAKDDLAGDGFTPTCSNTLSSFELGGLLPGREPAGVQQHTLEYQQGTIPSARMLHSAAVDAAAGVMYLYGGVCRKAGARAPADTTVGQLYAFKFDNACWRTLTTTGDCPRTTTLLAFFMWQGHLMAIPDCSSWSSRQQQQYQLLQLDVETLTWSVVPTQGTPPTPRTEAAVALVGNHLIVYGGKDPKAVPAKILGDTYCLDLSCSTWERVTMKWVTSAAGQRSNSSSDVGRACHPQQQQQQQGPGVMAGHAGAAYKGAAVFYGGYNHPVNPQPQARILVINRTVRAPTPAVAHLSGSGSTAVAFALQHCRQQLARLVVTASPGKVLLQPDDGQAVAVPGRLLALYSQLFDELFESLLEGEETPTVPVPGVSPAGVTHACRWMMGLLSLQGADMQVLTATYRAADVLIMEALLVEVLEQLQQLDVSLGANAAALLELAADFGTRAELQELAAAAQQQLCQQVVVGNAAAMMEVATRYSCSELRERCVDAMYQHRKNDVWGVLEFAAKFSLSSLQRSCLSTLQRTSRTFLVSAAENVMQVVQRHAPSTPQQFSSTPPRGVAAQRPQWHSSSPLVRMLEQELLQEFSAAAQEGGRNLVAYVTAAEKLQLAQLREGLLAAMCKPDTWRHLCVTGQAAVLRNKHPEFAAQCATAAV